MLCLYCVMLCYVIFYYVVDSAMCVVSCAIKWVSGLLSGGVNE